VEDDEAEEKKTNSEVLFYWYRFTYGPQ